MQLAVFAAYHLSLETSFLADEGATLPIVPSISAIGAREAQTDTDYHSAGLADHGIPDSLRAAEEKYSHNATTSQIFEGISASSTLLPLDGGSQGIISECRESESPVNHINSHDSFHLYHPNASCNGHLISPCSLADDSRTTGALTQYYDSYNSLRPPIAGDACQDAVLSKIPRELCHLENYGSHSSLDDFQAGDLDDQNKLSGGYLPGTDKHQSILVSLSSTCIPKRLACERSHLFRIKFYGSFDKPLGRYLREDLFDQVLPILFYLIDYVKIVLYHLLKHQFVVVFHCFLSGILLPVMQGAFRITCQVLHAPVWQPNNQC